MNELSIIIRSLIILVVFLIDRFDSGVDSVYEDEETEPVCVIIRYHKKILILFFNNNIIHF